MLFVATITHPMNLAIVDTTYTLEAKSFTEALSLLEEAGKLKDAGKVQMTKAHPLDAK